MIKDEYQKTVNRLKRWLTNGGKSLPIIYIRDEYPEYIENS